MIKTVFIIRHGQTDFNLNEQILGQKDILLNTKGVIDSYLALSLLFHSIKSDGKTLSDYTIVTSPLKRALFQAEVLNDCFDVDFYKDNGFMERNWGDYTSDYKSFHKGALYETPNNGESYNVFKERVVASFKLLLNKAENIVLITHMGIIREILKEYGNDRDVVDNGAVIKIEFENENIISNKLISMDEDYFLFPKDIKPIEINDCPYEQKKIVGYIKEKHKHQTRADGSNYYYHLLRVCNILSRSGEKQTNVLSASLLHDIIEDADGEASVLTEMYGNEVANIVASLSLKPNVKYNIQKEIYLQGIINYGEDAIKVKLADLIDNLSDTNGIDKERQLKMTRKALEFINKLFKYKQKDYSKTTNILINNLMFIILNRLRKKEA